MSRERALESAGDTALGQQKMLDVLKQFRILLKSIKWHYQSIEQKSGLSGPQIWAMAEIDANPDLKVSDIAERLALPLSTASDILTRLEALGVVIRGRFAHNHRTVRARLTAEGKAILRKAPRPVVGVLQQALNELSPAKLSSLHGDLAEVIRLMKYRAGRARSTPLSDL